MADRVFTTLNKVFDACLLVVLVLCFLVGLYSMIDSALVFQQASDESLLRYKPGSSAAASEDARQIDNVAWLTLDDTPIDYPVMQGADNKEYLNRDPYGDYSLSGSIFLDSNNRADFSDSYNLVYGHHMEADKMFGPLDDFLDADFFDAHRTGGLYVGDGTYYRLDVFAAVQTTAENATVFDVRESSAEQVLALLQQAAGDGAEAAGSADAEDASDASKATGDDGDGGADADSQDAGGTAGQPVAIGATRVVQYRQPVESGKVVALSTCEDVDTTQRTVVFATMTQAQAPAAEEAPDTVQAVVERAESIVPWLILAAAAVLVVWIAVYRRPAGKDRRE